MRIFLINKILYKNHPIHWDFTCSHFKSDKEKINYLGEIVSELNKNAIEAKIKIDYLHLIIKNTIEVLRLLVQQSVIQITAQNGLHFNQSHF